MKIWFKLKYEFIREAKFVSQLEYLTEMLNERKWFSHLRILFWFQFIET